MLTVKEDNLYMKVVEMAEGTDVVDTTHLIPLVDEIVPYVVIGSNKVVVTPPEGLLDIGKTNAKIENLRRELTPYAISPSGYFGLHTPFRSMPTQKSLLMAGRKDLVARIASCGGSSYVAAILGWNSRRLPIGMCRSWFKFSTC